MVVACCSDDEMPELDLLAEVAVSADDLSTSNKQKKTTTTNS